MHLKSQFGGGNRTLCVAQSIKPVKALIHRRLIERRIGRVAVYDLTRTKRGSTAKDHKVDQAVRPKAVRAVNRCTPRFAHRHQARNDAGRVLLGGAQNLAMVIRRNSAHVVMHRRQDRDRLFGHIHTGKNARAFRDTRQTLCQGLGRQVVEVEVDMIATRPHTAPFADFHCHAAADIIARRKILVVGRIALHEPFAFGIGQIPTLAARAFGNQTAGTVDAGGVELHELHVLQWQALTGDHAAAIAGASVCRGGREIGAAIATGCQHHRFGVEHMHGAVVQLPRDHALTDAVLRHNQIKREILDVEFSLLFQRLAIERMQDRVAGPVSRGTGPLYRGAFAELGGVTAEGTLVNLAFFSAAERNAVMLQLIDRLGCFTRKIFHRVGVTQPVGSLHSVIHMPLPAIGAHVAQRRGNTTLSGNSMRTGRKNLGDTGGAQPLLGQAQRRAQPGATGPYNNRVIGMRFIFVSSHKSKAPVGLKGNADDREDRKGRCGIGQADHADDRRFAGETVNIILDHGLNAQPIMIEANQEKQDRNHRRERTLIIGDNSLIGRAENGPESEDEKWCQD